MRAGRGGARAKPRLALLGDVGAQRAYNLFRAHDCDRCLLRRFDSNARRGVVAKRGPPWRHIARRRRRSCRPPVARGRAPGRRPRRVPRDRGGTRRRRPSVVIANRDPLRGRVRRGSRPCPRPPARTGRASARPTRPTRPRPVRPRPRRPRRLAPRPPSTRAPPPPDASSRRRHPRISSRRPAHAPRVRPPSSLLASRPVARRSPPSSRSRKLDAMRSRLQDAERTTPAAANDARAARARRRPPPPPRRRPPPPLPPRASTDAAVASTSRRPSTPPQATSARSASPYLTERAKHVAVHRLENEAQESRAAEAEEAERREAAALARVDTERERASREMAAEWATERRRLEVLRFRALARAESRFHERARARGGRRSPRGSRRAERPSPRTRAPAKVSQDASARGVLGVRARDGVASPRRAIGNSRDDFGRRLASARILRARATTRRDARRTRDAPNGNDARSPRRDDGVSSRRVSSRGARRRERRREWRRFRYDFAREVQSERNVVAAFREWAPSRETRRRSDGIRGGARRVGDARRGGASRGASRETRRAIVRARVARRDVRALARRFAEAASDESQNSSPSVATSRRRRRERARASRARRGSSLARRGFDGDAPSGRRRTRGDARGDATIDAPFRRWRDEPRRRAASSTTRDDARRRRRGSRPDARRRGGVPRTRRRGGSRGGGGGVVAREGDARRVGVGRAGRVRRRADAEVRSSNPRARGVRSRRRTTRPFPRSSRPRRSPTRPHPCFFPTSIRTRTDAVDGGAVSRGLRRARDLRRRVRVDGGGAPLRWRRAARTIPRRNPRGRSNRPRGGRRSVLVRWPGRRRRRDRTPRRARFPRRRRRRRGGGGRRRPGRGGGRRLRLRGHDGEDETNDAHVLIRRTRASSEGSEEGSEGGSEGSEGSSRGTPLVPRPGEWVRLPNAPFSPAPPRRSHAAAFAAPTPLVGSPAASSSETRVDVYVMGDTDPAPRLAAFETISGAWTPRR